MATAVRRHSIVNPARRNRAHARKNKARRHMSDKQIRHFGTKAQKAALKRKHRRNRATAHRRRTVARANPRRSAPRRTHRTKAHRRRATRRSNPGEILSLTLGNPAKRRKKVAATQRNRRRHASASNPRRRHNRRRHNPVMHHRQHHRRPNAVRHHRMHHRRNPAGLNVPSLVTDGLFVVGGLVGSRLLTQMVLGANNVGMWGYVGNAAAGGLLATALHMVTKNPRVTAGVITGTAAGIVARLLQDYTPLGTYLQQAGFGDYSGGGAHGVGAYLPWNGVTPQRYVNALNSAQVQIPQGWAPTVQVSAPAAKGAGVSGLYGGGYSLY